MSALLCAQILRVCRETPTVRLPDAVRASEVWLQHGRRLPNLGGWPARHRRDAQAHYCKMSLKELPEELCSLMATLLPRNDLLALRQCNKSSAAAVQRSIQGDDRFEKMIFDALAEPRNIESEGRIFGGGARELVSFCAADAALPALQSAITETAGGLRKLCLYRCAVTDARLLEMCRACPLLQTLVCVIDVPMMGTDDPTQRDSARVPTSKTRPSETPVHTASSLGTNATQCVESTIQSSVLKCGGLARAPGISSQKTNL